MKNYSKTRRLILSVLAIFVSLMAYSQTCDGTVQNRCDSTPKVAVKQDCNGTITQGALAQITEGSWAQPSETIIHNQPCDPNLHTITFSKPPICQ